MTNLLQKTLRYVFNERARRNYKKHYQALLKHNNIPDEFCLNEKEWIAKWGCLGKLNTVEYRLFSHYVGYDIKIVPEVMCKKSNRTIIKPRTF